MRFTKETAKRALRTFIQAAIAYIAVNLTMIDFNEAKEMIKSAVIELIVSAVAAGIAAVMKLQQIEEVKEGEDDEQGA